jgi:hypothetical protein
MPKIGVKQVCRGHGGQGRKIFEVRRGKRFEGLYFDETRAKAEANKLDKKRKPKKGKGK